MRRHLAENLPPLAVFFRLTPLLASEVDGLAPKCGSNLLGCAYGFYGDPHARMPLHARLGPALSGKIGCPLPDRIDIQPEAPAVPYRELRAGEVAESSADMLGRVSLSARARPDSKGGAHGGAPTILGFRFRRYALKNVRETVPYSGDVAAKFTR